VLKVRGTLEAQQVRAIRHLIASAVNGLKPQRCRWSTRPAGFSPTAAPTRPAAAPRRRAQARYERRMREQVESIVTSVVGPGHARVQLTADFDFNRITQTSDKFDPESRVVRSSQTREETMASDDTAGAVSVGNELPGANTPARGDAAARPEPQDRGNRQLRDLPHHQDRGHRRRPRQSHLGRGRGRRHLCQE
jgi:flagellar M-ring protein FliF